MQPRPPRMQQQLRAQDPLTEKRRLLAEIQQQKHQQLRRTEQRIALYRKQLQKMSESNIKHTKRLARHRARFHQLMKHRNQPQYFLHMSGFMNEYMQQFMLAHDIEIMSMNQPPNLDNMSYEQLLELGESIGKVSKGITKQQFESLPRKKHLGVEQNCPICCTEFNVDDVAVVLFCRHPYHEECIGAWLKDENSCPICKKNVLGK